MGHRHRRRRKDSSLCDAAAEGDDPMSAGKHDAPSNNILVLPAVLVAETADGAVLAAGLQAQDAQSLGNNHLLDVVVRGRDTLEDLQALHGGGTTGGLVGNHTTDGLVEDTGRGAEVEGTTTGGVEPSGLAEVGVELHYNGPSCQLSCRSNVCLQTTSATQPGPVQACTRRHNE